MKKFLILTSLVLSSLCSFAATYSTNGGFVFTKTKKQLVIVLKDVKAQDKNAFEKHLNELIKVQEGGLLKENLDAEILEVSENPGIIKVGLINNQYQVWTIAEALKKNKN